MRFFLTICFLIAIGQVKGQLPDSENFPDKDIFKYLEIKTHFGAFLKSDDMLGNSGLLDNGYAGVTVKLGWQPTNPESWASRYGYPSYGVGFYSGFLSNAEVFGNPNAVYGFIKFPLSSSDKRTELAIEPSLGLTYKLNPYDEEINPLNNAIGARFAVYFNIDLGFTYKWTRELDLLYGLDFSHFSNGSTFKPNSGLNLYGFNLGLRYHYNAAQLRKNKDPYTNEILAARFKRPERSPRDKTKSNAISVYTAGGIAQSESMAGSDKVLGTFTGVIDYEHQFDEMNGISAGVDFFYDNRLRDRAPSDRWLTGLHAGYDFSFYKFSIRFQAGTYLGDDKGKGNFFMRPALRYNFSKRFFAQVGLKTLDGGAADYIEYGIGFKPFYR
jgi:hypothetical protein